MIDANARRGTPTRSGPIWSGPFGGITAAALIRAIETHPDRIGEPLALTVNFAAADRRR